MVVFIFNNMFLMPKTIKLLIIILSMSMVYRLQVQEDTDMSSLEDMSDCSSDSMEVCCEDLGKHFLNYPGFMTRILHLHCNLLLKSFDFKCGHNVRLAKLDVITACAITRCNESMLFCFSLHIQSHAIYSCSA